jgi:hypothetical protein
VRDHQFVWGYTWTKTFLHSKGLALAGEAARGASAQAAAPADTWRDAASALRLARQPLVCNGGVLLLAKLIGLIHFLKKRFADRAYRGPVFHAARDKILPQLKTEIVKHFGQAKGFVVLPNRGINDGSARSP